MVYKTRKNKRICKKQSRRMYGGEPSGVPSEVPSTVPSGVPSGAPSQSPAVVPTSEPTSYPSMLTGVPGGVPSGEQTSHPSMGEPNVIEEENKAPTVMSNLENAGNLVVSALSNVTAEGLQSAEKGLGIDPNISFQDNIKEIGDKVENISAALDSPEGEKLKEETGELLADSVTVLKPSIEKAQDIASDSLKKLGKTGTSIIVTALNEIPPIFFINEMSKFGTAVAQAGEGVAKLTETGSEAVKSLEEQKIKASSLYEKVTNFFKNTSTNINKNVADGIASIQERVTEKGKEIIDNKKNVEFPRTLDVKTGGSLKQLHNIAKMIGGRVHKSQLEFMKPSVNGKLRKYGVTKRRHNKQKHTTQRRR